MSVTVHSFRLLHQLCQHELILHQVRNWTQSPMKRHACHVRHNPKKVFVYLSMATFILQMTFRFDWGQEKGGRKVALLLFCFYSVYSNKYVYVTPTYLVPSVKIYTATPFICHNLLTWNCKETIKINLHLLKK